MTTFNSKNANYTVYGPGEEVTSSKPGDFFLLRNTTLFSRLILFGQGLRFHGENRKYSKWSHCGGFIDNNGTIIESLSSGVKIDNISKYKDLTYYVVNTKLSSANRIQSVNAAKTFLKDKYGWVSDMSIGFQFATGVKLRITVNNTINCSGLVAMMLWGGGIFFNGTPQLFAPADLASAFDVLSPTKIQIKNEKQMLKERKKNK
jgi:hypothetical protein